LKGGVKRHSLRGKTNVPMSGRWFNTFPTLAIALWRWRDLLNGRKKWGLDIFWCPNAYGQP
jgi:hypothetical protein